MIGQPYLVKFGSYAAKIDRRYMAQSGGPFRGLEGNTG